MKAIFEGLRQFRDVVPDRGPEARLADSMERVQAGAEFYRELKDLWQDATEDAEPWQKAALVVGVAAFIAPPIALPAAARGVVGRLVAAGLIAASQLRPGERDYDETVRQMRKSARAVRSLLRNVKTAEAPGEPEPEAT